MPRQPATIQARHTREHKCCGLVEDAKYQVRVKRENRTEPQPWIVRKFLVFVSIAIIAYSAYVYIGRFCVPFIKGRYNRRAAGVVMLIVFLILYFWAVWGYAKIVLVSPGYAKDHVNSTPQPQQAQASFVQIPPKEANAVQFEAPPSEPRFSYRTETPFSSVGSRHSRTESVGGPSYEDILLRTNVDRAGSHSRDQSETNAGVTDTLPPPVLSPTPAQRKLRKIFHPPQSKVPQPKIYIARRPPMSALLLPENRYCNKDGILKPYRTHHCRHCGTCVLRYDHHCPWIGQCVGARNHKYFVNFTEAAGVLCIYIFSTLLAFTVRDLVVHQKDTDPQHIVLIALAGLFGLFSWTLTVSHVLLILRSRTTVEHMIIHHMEERESDQLDRAFACWDFRAKRLTRKEWDREWGNLSTEGHIWWMGDRRKAWEDVMGQNVWGWFLPIGRGLGDGLSYPVNPRFDAEGRWRRRSEWPPELQ